MITISISLVTWNGGQSNLPRILGNLCWYFQNHSFDMQIIWSIYWAEIENYAEMCSKLISWETRNTFRIDFTKDGI